MAAKSLADLQRERGRLIERIAVQRATLGLQLVPVVHALQWGERAMQTVQSATRFVREHPLAMGSLALVFALRRPRRWGRWLRRGLFLWRSWRGLRTVAATVQRHLDRQG
jgi:hypothetical protein